jgi:integrase
VLSERLGHATVGFTMEVYGHLYDEQHQEAALSVSELLGGRGKQLEA